MIAVGTIKIKYNEERGLMGPAPYIDDDDAFWEPIFAAPTYEELRQTLKPLGVTLCKKEYARKTKVKNLYRCQAKIDTSIRVEVDEDGEEYWTLSRNYFTPCDLGGSSYEELRAKAKKYMGMNLPEEKDIHMIENGNGFSYFDIWE